jgi:hypothetical protein
MSGSPTSRPVASLSISAHLRAPSGCGGIAWRSWVARPARSSAAARVQYGSRSGAPISPASSARRQSPKVSPSNSVPTDRRWRSP